MQRTVDRRRSLQKLEGVDWGEPAYDSYLVTTTHRLRRKRIGQFTVEDLRIMIGQGIGLIYLLPLAIEELAKNPLAAGDFYPGDLLSAVTKVPAAFYAVHPDFRESVAAICEQAEARLSGIGQNQAHHLRECIASFRT